MGIFGPVGKYRERRNDGHGSRLPGVQTPVRDRTRRRVVRGLALLPCLPAAIERAADSKDGRVMMETEE